MSARRCWPVLLVMTLVLPCARPVSAADDFTFTRVAPYAVSGQSVVFDSRRHRWLAFGGVDEVGDVGVVEVKMPSAPGRALQERMLRPTGVPPHPGFGADPLLAVYDSTRDLVYMSGGSGYYHYTGIPDTSWVLHLGEPMAWTGLGSKDANRPRRPYCGWLLDRLHDRLVLFGGGSSATTNELWTLSLGDTSGWQVTPISGQWPTARSGMAFSVEPDGRHALLFAGSSSVGTTHMSQDLWRLELSDSLRWDSLSTSGLAPDFSFGVALVPMPDVNEMLAVGAYTVHQGAVDTTWTIGLSDHVWRAHAGGPPRTIFPLCTGWDPELHQCVGWTDRTEQWEAYQPLSASWSDVGQTGAALDFSSVPGSIAVDTHQDRLLLWNGGRLLSRSPVADSVWRELPIPGAVPPPYAGMACVFDSVGSRFIVIGNASAYYYGTMDSLWIATLAGPSAWTAYRIEHRADLMLDHYPTVVWDAARNRALVIGAHTYGDSVGAHHLPRSGDPLLISSLDLNGTPTLAPFCWPDSVSGRQGVPLRRANVGAGIDPKRDRLYLFGGDQSFFGSVMPYSDAWSVDLASGRDVRRVASGVIDLIYTQYPQLCYDPTGDRFLAVNAMEEGIYISAPGRAVFELDLGGATDTLFTTAVPDVPLATIYSALLYDPARACMWHWGGMNLRSLTWPLPSLAETAPAVADAASGRASVRWTLAGGAPGAADVERSAGDAWQRLDTVHFGADGVVAYDDPAAPSSARVGYRLALAGAGGVHHTSEVWLGSAVAERGGLRLLGVRPQPASGPLTIELSLPIDAIVTLDLYDLAGRRARSQSVALSAGRHVFTPDGLERMPPGLYLLRASALGSSSTRRVVIFR